MLTWENIQSVDDLVLPECRRITEQLVAGPSIRCPHLRKLGVWFYYCGGGIPEGTKLELKPFNQIIAAKQSATQLSMHCTADYEICCCYRGDLPFP